MKGICKVCELIDEKLDPKEVFWCETCKQYICHECKPNLLKRGKAMLKIKLNIK